MPAASSSRRQRSRRAPSSDHIEEDDPSQRRDDAVDVDDDADSEDAQPARKTATVKKEKKSKARRTDTGASAAGPSNAVDDDGDDRIDIQNFHDQPLDKKEGGKLHGIAQDWELIRKQIHQSSFRLVKDVAVSLADVMEVGKAGEALEEVEAIMRKLLDIDHEMRSHEETLNNLYQSLMQGEVVENVLEMYETEVRQRVDGYQDKTTRQKYASVDAYVEFKQGIYEAQNPGETIPPINDLVPREDGDASDDEDDLEIGGVTQDYKCPITLTLLKDPMTSTVCGHSYSRAAIQEFLARAGRDGKPCPASGCNKRITMDQLKANKELEKRMKIAQRRQRQQEESEEDDDEDVIE